MNEKAEAHLSAECCTTCVTNGHSLASGAAATGESHTRADDIGLLLLALVNASAEPPAPLSIGDSVGDGCSWAQIETERGPGPEWGLEEEEEAGSGAGAAADALLEALLDYTHKDARCARTMLALALSTVYTVLRTAGYISYLEYCILSSRDTVLQISSTQCSRVQFTEYRPILLLSNKRMKMIH